MSKQIKAVCKNHGYQSVREYNGHGLGVDALLSKHSISCRLQFCFLKEDCTLSLTQEEATTVLLNPPDDGFHPKNPKNSKIRISSLHPHFLAAPQVCEIVCIFLMLGVPAPIPEIFWDRCHN